MVDNDCCKLEMVVDMSVGGVIDCDVDDGVRGNVDTGGSADSDVGVFCASVDGNWFCICSMMESS